MERLVEWNCKEKNSALPKCINEFGDVVDLETICAQLAAIYDIVGDISLNRLRELVEADREGRCVVLPVRGNTDKDGENALKYAMHTCFYHNNPVTRYLADAVAEKLTREAAESALKGEQDERI